MSDPAVELHPEQELEAVIDPEARARLDTVGPTVEAFEAEFVTGGDSDEKIPNIQAEKLSSQDDESSGRSHEDEVAIDIDHEKLEQARTYASAATDATSLATRTQSRSSVAIIKKKSWRHWLNPLRWSPAPPVPDQKSPSREHTASIPSRLFFQWMAPLMSTGYKRGLEHNDIWTVNPDRSIDLLTEKLQRSFNFRRSRGDKYPLIFAMHDTFKREFWIGGTCQFCSNVLQVVSPYTLKYLIQFAGDAYTAQRTGQPAPAIGRGLGLVFGITAMQMLQSLGTNHFIYRGMMVGGESRAVLTSIIFEKAMSISGRAKAGGRQITELSEQEKQEAVKSRPEKKSKKQSKNRPVDAGKGIAGDGTGWSNGRIVSLMSVDTSRVDTASGMFHLIWTAPIACIITLALLIVNLTYSALAGFGLLIISLPILTDAVKRLFVRRRAINKVTDQRVSLTQEILQAVKFVKLFGWENAFLTRLSQLRGKEIRAVQVLLSIRNAINAISMAMPTFASMLAFITFSLTHTGLNPAHIFSSLALFNSLRLPLNMLPLVIGQVVDAWSSLCRIQDFLLSEDQEEEAKPDLGADHAVELSKASFTWERTVTRESERERPGSKKQAKEQDKSDKQAKRQVKHQTDAVTTATETGDGAIAKALEGSSTPAEEGLPFQLEEIDIQIGRNELVAVIGSVGSGKSSLLAALAGDMRRTQGNMVLGASRAFCPQYAWIQNATVRQNILFGKGMERHWYKDVVKACALEADFAMLPNGDDTEIGERGITVSGGQKARINLARSIYFDSDLVLMDDPLSAVDAHVGHHIFDHAILGLMKDKARILATHQLWVLNRCDRIIWLEQGKIQAIDTFSSLMANNQGFKQMMATTSAENEKAVAVAVNEDEIEGEKKELKKTRKRGAGLMQAEERAVASVPWSVYIDYVRASGSIINAPVVIFLLILSQLSNIATSLWLSWWTADKFGYTKGVYIGTFAALGVVQTVMMFAFAVSLTLLGTRSSKTMLHRAMTRVLRAPMSFFDTTPLGRITNRFSRDVDVMDNNLTDAMRMFFITMGMMIAVFALIIAYFHYFAIALAPLSVVFILAAGYYRASAREMKRYESVLRSNVFAKFSEGLSGTACIRAYGLKSHFIADLRSAIDEMDSAYFLTFANQRWLATRLDVIGNLLVFVTGILVVTSRFDVSPSTAGLVLSYVLSVVQLIQFTVRQLAEVENGMNATERLHYYGKSLPEEAPAHTIDIKPAWPEAGEIKFQNVDMRYRAGLPLVLSDLSMHIRGGERIGVVGRTGAGKSSIMSTLFRITELSGGKITIDGQDISTLGLHDLRSRMAIIPQDPTLFRGTVRSNLDPFSERTDLELWDALRQADLVPAGLSLSDSAANNVQQSQQQGRITLDSPVEDEGLNFSLGQRQLMALARALVRRSRIIVCDEATSSVDMETDEKIQRTMAEGFKGCTLLCIAHRLRTIIGYDRICVMDKGRIVEMDTPLSLWATGGIFKSMCERSGIGKEDF